MKNQTTRLCLLFAFVLGLNACKKNEQAFEAVQTTPTGANAVSFVPTKLTNIAGAYFQSIDTVCAPYLTYSTLIDIRKFPEDRYNIISDGNLSLDTGPTIWKFYNRKDHHANWANWNKPPYVEMDNPPIWESDDAAPTTLKLSKECYVIGFELSALPGLFNVTPFTYTVRYSHGDHVIGFISNIVAPNSARLFAVKSDIPIDKVEMFYTGSPSLAPGFFALANIRYVTDKAVYDAHK